MLDRWISAYFCTGLFCRTQLFHLFQHSRPHDHYNDVPGEHQAVNYGKLSTYGVHLGQGLVTHVLITCVLNVCLNGLRDLSYFNKQVPISILISFSGFTFGSQPQHLCTESKWRWRAIWTPWNKLQKCINNVSRMCPKTGSPVKRKLTKTDVIELKALELNSFDAWWLFTKDT